MTLPRLLRGVVALALATVGVLVAMAAPPAAASPGSVPRASEPTPSLQVGATALVLGERFDVALAGWPAGVVAVSVCGQGAGGGSRDCAVEASSTVTVGQDGTGRGSLVAAVPPSGCPCVVRGATLTGGITAVLPVVLPDVPVDVPGDIPVDIPVDVAEAGAPGADPGNAVTTGDAGPATDATPGLLVASAVDASPGLVDRLVGLVGGPRRYDVALTVQNTGVAALPGRTVDVLAGRNDLGGTSVAEVEVAELAPGATATYVVPVELGAPVLGRYVLHGVLDPADPGSAFVAEVEGWPLVVPVLVLFVVVWVVLRRTRYQGVASLRALAVTGLATALVVVGHWGATSWSEDARARAAQETLLAQFAPALGASAAPVSGQEVRPAGTTAAPATGDLVGVLRFGSPDGSTDGVQLAVVEGVTPDQLGRGPGHYPGTALPGEVGNVVVAGHNARSGAGAPFDRLHDVTVGDTVRFETPSGTWTYTVTGTRVVAPTEVSVLLPVRDTPGAEPAAAQLTLITCDYSQGARTNRLIVEAEITDPATASPTVAAAAVGAGS